MRNKFSGVSNPNSFVSCPGSRYHIEYSPVLNADGTVTLVESGKTDVVEFINSFRDTTDMSYILRRLKLGDTSVLSRGAPFYGDFTSMPKSYADALQLVMDAEASFNKLPLDVRNQFDNDYKQWFAQAGSESWMSKMDSVLIKPVVEKVEVVSDES